MMKGIRRPDIVFYLRAENVDLISKRTDFGNERYETIDFQRQVTVNFDSLLKDEAKKNEKCSIIHEINSFNNINMITNEIWEKIKNSGLKK